MPMPWSTEGLYPNVVRSRQARERPFALVANVDGTSEEVTFADLERASNRAAWFLDSALPSEGKFLYIGVNDLRYLIWVLAAMKTGKCVLFPSPGNTIPANRRFFQTVGVTTLLFAPEASGILAPLLDGARDIITPLASPSYEAILSKDAVDEYPFDKTFDEIKHTPFMGLHTSGTSGHPKPIYWNHLAAAALVSANDAAFQIHFQGTPIVMLELVKGQNLLVPFPLFHVGGLGSLMTCIHDDFTTVVPAAGTQLSPQNFIALLEAGRCTSACVPPSLLEATLNYPPGLERLSQLEHVAYTGGPLNPARGEILARHIRHLFPIFGSTEGGPSHLVSTGDSSHWNRLEFVDVGQRMEEVAPGFYELVFPRCSLVEQAYAFFHTCPHLKNEYRTSDLFSPAEGEDGWWVYRGRVDNWIAMSNGFKFDPTEMEHTISAHPSVSAVLVAGSHRFRLCLLVELKEASADPSAQEQALEDLWPTIGEANRQAPKFGRVPKELVIFAAKEKPFSRAGKGTVQRRLTIQAYDQEIDDRYARVEDGLLTSGLPILGSTERQDIIPFLVELYSQTIDTGEHEVKPDENVFALGLDSLGAFVLSARLKAALRARGIEDEKLNCINHSFIYTATTIAEMAERLSVLLTGAKTVNDTLPLTVQEYREALLQQGEERIRAFSVSTTGRIQHGETIVLTGSTGSLGSYILKSLLQRDNVSKIYCLNRKRSSEKTGHSTSSRSQKSGPGDSRVVFLQADLSDKRLGLPNGDYNALVEETTSIIHNAFPVNFLLSLQAFEPQVHSLVNLLELAAKGQRSPNVYFISSIAAGSPATGDRETVPEAVISPSEAGDLLAQGYAQAKYTCERMMQTYTTVLNGKRKAVVLRVGQICGPLTGDGVWTPREWVPSLAISSKFLSVAPDSLGAEEIDWIPVDSLSTIVTEIVCSSSTENGQDFIVYNVINPAKTPWATLLPALQRVVPSTVSAAEWIARLESSPKGSHLLGENPAIKLIDFYRQAMLGDRSAVKIETGYLTRDSTAARDLGPLKADNMTRWMQGWGL